MRNYVIDNYEGGHITWDTPTSISDSKAEWILIRTPVLKEEKKKKEKSYAKFITKEPFRKRNSR